MARQLFLQTLPDPSWEDRPPENRGPYRKAPDEYGGGYYLVTPFSDPQPWLKHPLPDRQVPEGFALVFGPRPSWKDYQRLGKHALMAFESAKVIWESELKGFKSVGPPPNYDPALRADAEAVLVKWLLGKPVFYEGRFGWMGRFLESDIWDYDSSAWQIINYPHHVVSTYQITNFRQNGKTPPVWHPFVPDRWTAPEDE